MNQSANIAASITNLWRDNTTLSGSSYTPLPNSGLVPGGLLYGIGKQPKGAPYALMVVKLDGEPDYQTGSIYCQNYRVRIDVWSNSQLAKAEALQAALETLMGAYTKLDSLTNNAWTLLISLEPANVEEEEQRTTMTDASAGNVFVAGASWQIQLQESRNMGP